jgi:protein-S-isoprenylcysteine O-methyltransferase Ste14
VRFSLETLDAVALVAVMLCWIGFALPFLFRKRPPRTEERKRDRLSLLGIVLQGTAYSIVWVWRRPAGEPLAPALGPWGRVAFDVGAVVLASWAVWLVAAAVVVLGKQWSLAARVVEGHELATEGPYAIVRHPIYTAMLAMLVATGIVVSRWPALVAALPVFATGMLVRIRVEERLLRETFGARYDDYARRVPAVIPVRLGRATEARP